MQLQLDVPAVFRHLGGKPAEVEAGLKNMGFAPIGAKSMQKWRERKMIPMPRWLELEDLARANGKPLVLSQFVIRS